MRHHLTVRSRAKARGAHVGISGSVRIPFLAPHPKGITVISKKAIALCATVGVTLSGIALATPANAEPVSNSYSIVGSDTLEDVVSALANGTNISGSTVRSTVNLTSIGSFDATGSSYITTKSGGVRFGRPNGSGDGVKALSRSIDGAAYTSGTPGSPTGVVITGQVDIARSSSAGTANANGELMYVPFGRDAIAYAYNGTAADISSLSGSEMKSLYECSVTTVNGVTVTPIIPQNGSGTRKDWLAKIGSSETAMRTVAEGGCVVEGQEHDATTLTTNSVMPMAVSRWIAMNTGASYDKRGTGTLGSMVAGTSPVTGTGSAMVPNPTYYADTTWGRDTYLVVEYARVSLGNAKYDANLAKLIDPTQATALTNTSAVATRAGAVKKKYGFLAPTSGVVAYRVAKTS
jgi:ABC-type phosphate transport system substrate-binding protein